MEPVSASGGAGGAGDRNRTRNLLFTKQLLCQLSYAGMDPILYTNLPSFAHPLRSDLTPTGHSFSMAVGVTVGVTDTE